MVLAPLTPETNIQAEYWDIPHPPHGNSCGVCVGPITSWVYSIIEIKVSAVHALWKPVNQSA